MRSAFFFAGLSSALLIACAPSNVARDPATDPSCIVYFDGCNTCTKMGGGVACTKKFCDPGSMQKPYCMEFKKD